MRLLAIILVYFGTVFIFAVAIMFAVALGIIMAYEYMKKGQKK